VDLSDFLDSKIELETEILVAGVNIDFCENLLLRTLNALPPPADSTAEAASMCEISALIWSRCCLRDSAVTDGLLFIDYRKASSLFLKRCNCPDPLKFICASFTVRRLSSTSAWKKSDKILRTVSFYTFVTIEMEEKESSVRLPFGKA
jgi:hypothetical protein